VIDNVLTFIRIAIVEDIAEIRVVDMLSDATLNTGRTGIIVILDRTPKVRNPETIPKIKK
jgi:uncharacterized protein YbcI